MVQDTYRVKMECVLSGFTINNDRRPFLLLNGLGSFRMALLPVDDMEGRIFSRDHPDDRIFYPETYVVSLRQLHQYMAKRHHLVCRFCPMLRSEERRVGKECRCRCSTDETDKRKIQ